MSDKSQKGEIILFQANDGRTKIQVHFEEKSVWLSQKSLAELYQVSVPSINEHLAHIFDEGELESDATIRKFRIVQTEGKRIKERLREVYRCKGVKKARINLERLINQMALSRLEAAQRLRNTLIKWKEEILNYFENKWTNGFTEAINGVAKALQRRARGYKNFVNYRSKTLNACFY